MSSDDINPEEWSVVFGDPRADPGPVMEEYQERLSETVTEEILRPLIEHMNEGGGHE